MLTPSARVSTSTMKRLRIVSSFRGGRIVFEGAEGTPAPKKGISHPRRSRTPGRVERDPEPRTADGCWRRPTSVGNRRADAPRRRVHVRPRVENAQAGFSACAAHDHDSDRERRDAWRREAQARPPPCPGAAWVERTGVPDGRWEPGRWTREGTPGDGAYPNGYPAPGDGGSGR